LHFEYEYDGLVARNLSDLTIIIPTISRPLFIRRQVRYWSSLNAQVVILDGAQNSNLDPCLQDLPSHIRYIHQPSKFNVRLSTASQYISTDFACLLPDDELFLPQGLERAMTVLRQDESLIGVVGKVLYFFVDQGRFLSTRAYEDWKNFRPESVTAWDRVREVLPPNKAHKVQFGVFRSEQWKEIFFESYRDFYSTGYLYERMLNLYSAVLGKTVVIDELLWMRSMENPPISNDAVPRDDRGGMLGWADDPAMAGEVNHYLSKVQDLIQRGEGISEEQARFGAHTFVFGGFEKHRAKVERSTRRMWPRLRRWMMAKSPKALRLWAKRRLPASVLEQFEWSGYLLPEIQVQLTDRKIGYSKSELEVVMELALQTDQEVREIH
jgi:glycosyltransferase domain-containing protein